MGLGQQRREPAWELRPPTPQHIWGGGGEDYFGGRPPSPHNHPPADIPDWALDESFDSQPTHTFHYRSEAEVMAWLDGIPSITVEDETDDENKDENEDEMRVDIFTQLPFAPGDQVYTLPCTRRFAREGLVH